MSELTAEERARHLVMDWNSADEPSDLDQRITAALHAHAEAVRAEEREACAKIAEIHGKNDADDQCADPYIGTECCGPTIAAAIRART